ncbi:MAG TPA: peptidoglycan DD-metalloendopeptidase family protein [Acidimicrobiia bacterium]|jgi:murein DD-endopeptidase MepM/ murein hydrolase activator NlpD|nr:peptidoglycan DD-metalloendopeptidase family protein [Acidimicrobiia bacterium]
MKRIVRFTTGLLVVALAMPAFAAVTDEDIERARDEVNRIVSESAELAELVTEAYGRQAALEREIGELESSIEFAEREIVDTEARLEELAVELYMGTTGGSSLSVLFTATDQQYPAGMEYLHNVNGVDASVVDRLREMRDRLDQQTTRLGEAREEQVALAAELEEMAGDLQGDLVEAQQVYDDLVEKQRQEEEARRRAEEARLAAAAAAAAEAAATPASGSSSSDDDSPPRAQAPDPPLPPPGSGACPVAGAVSFSDSWGAPRSGGRSHKGVDMIAARGTPIVAVYSGRVKRLSNSSLGGKSVYFVSDAGDMYYYAHLDGFGDISAGMSVPAGYVLGYNGSTGNAPDWLPHLHWEYHPGGGAAVNPYPLARELCG